MVSVLGGAAAAGEVDLTAEKLDCWLASIGAADQRNQRWLLTVESVAASVPAASGATGLPSYTLPSALVRLDAHCP
ncbi:MAG: hypothetical protein M3276_05215 [Actinomycetota bacterium]|nr:hypothetical protein [Actinomycetota bacterium]